jgi:L-2-hydroxyglutarate oxidase LhgO
MKFETSIRKYWPGLPDNSLLPGYAGIRPKLKTVGGGAADFIIDGPEQLGFDGLVALHGIESPGLTSSLSLGEAAYDKMFGIT